MMVGLKRISTALGLLAVTASTAMAQGVSNPNQKTADAVAQVLRGSKALAGSRIEIEARGSVVTLSGVLTSQAQKAELLARAQYVPGVSLINDRLEVGDSTVRPAQYQPQVALGHHLRGGG